MSMKGIRRILSFHGPWPTATPSSLSPSSPSHPLPSSAPSSPNADHSYASDLIHEMTENITRAEPVIHEWNVTGLETTTASDRNTPESSLFHDKNRERARLFLDSVMDVNHSMHYFSASSGATSRHQLVRAQRLMETAMKRLQKEFFQILSSIRDRIEIINSSGGDDSVSAAMGELRAIAECMVSSGYSKECVRVYQILRRSVVEEGIYNLGFHRMNHSQLQKLDSDAIGNRIKIWIEASRPIIQTIFPREKLLCENVFGSCSHLIAESCFAEISRDLAINFFEFPEMIVKVEKKRSLEKVGDHYIDLYNSISILLPDIQSLFKCPKSSTVLIQVTTSVNKLSKSIQSSSPHVNT
ncbi:hypothetical protein ZOSMA_356G00090 [Zostera marina]|uniref:Exocyst subunit Exo70 family protein n=1 Tax=Zostera marina TaxID=29655 RepID=A0A0K9P6N1_ZOSMR|nr:hypothetical protein ZOSMA_356G00090 [Zostera marina]